MTEIVRKRSSKWDVVPDTSIPIEDQHVPGTSIPTEDQHDSNIHCEKTGDTMHDKNSNLELSDSKAMKWSNAGNSNLESSGSQAIKWSNVEPKDTMFPKDSAWLNVEPKDTTLPNDSAWSNVEPKDTLLPKDSAWSNVESKDTTLPKDSTWSNVEPKDPTLPKDSAWSSLDVGSENRDGGNILSTTKTWGGGQWSISPGLDSWSRSRSRSPKRERSRSRRSRSRSPSRSFSHEKDGWNDRSRRGNHETYGHDDGRHSSSGPTESRGSRHERGGPMGHVDDDRRQRGYSRDRPFHGERKTQEPDRDNRNPCFDFRKGRCFRGSACKYAHHASSADGYGARSTDEAAREKAHDRHDLALPFENRHRHNNRELPPCKFFAHGQCRKGASCSFPHLAPENVNGSLRPADDRWGLRPDNGNNLEGSKNVEWQDKATEDAPRSPKWRFDSSKRVGISDLHPPEKFLNSNRDQHAYYMGREQSKQIHEDLPPWNPPETYHTLPNKAPGFPLTTSQQDMTQVVPDSHQFISNCNTFVTDNSGGVDSSASHLSSMVTGSIPRFNVNEQSQQMGLQAPLNPQFPMQTDTGDRVTKPDINDSNSIQITAEAAIAQNLVTSEQVSQVKNISASLAQIFATGQRLPQLYASLNSAVAAPGMMMPSHAFSHPNSMRPLAPMGVEMVQTNTGFWPQSKQYDPISDSIKSDNPPGFALQQNVSNEELVKPTKSLNTLTETAEFNDNDPKKNSGTEEKGYDNNENHGSGQPEMNRDIEAKEINEVAGEGGKETETDHSKETVANVGRIEEESMKSKEAKGMRMFKFALVEFVKEMLKPTWKEGQMSKEAHKTIVKKVVDKVTGTLQGPQIPQTQEKIDHYLLFSKTKLEKLVQAYVEKYLKI